MVIADTPYNDGEIPVVTDILANLPEEVEFVVHLGDIKNGSSVLITADYLSEISSLLQTSTVPLFIILGDNEFNDSDDPAGAFTLWSDEFGYFDQNWTHDIGVTYQDIRPENFSFVINDTLFVGINLVGGQVHDADEFAARSADDLVWIEDMFSQYGAAASNAVIFGHASPSYSEYSAFKQGFISVAEDFQKPILYLQGDLHDWTLDDSYAGTDNIKKIILERTGPGGGVKGQHFRRYGRPVLFRSQFRRLVSLRSLLLNQCARRRIAGSDVGKLLGQPATDPQRSRAQREPGFVVGLDQYRA